MLDHKVMAAELVDVAGDGIIAVDRQGTVLVFNQAAADIFGRRREEIVGNSLGCLFAPGRDRDHQHFLEELIANGLAGRSHVEGLGHHADGHAIQLEISLSATSIEGEPIFIASIRDVAKSAEAVRRNQLLMEQLTQVQKMEALGTLAAGVAHDFNNMLGALMGYASAMVRELDPGHRHFEDAMQIVGITRRAKRLTDKLLAFTRQADFTFAPVSVSAVVRDVTSLLQRTISKQVIVRTKLERDLVVDGDRSQLEQLLMNVCLNSRDAMPDGGELTLSARSVSLSKAEAASRGVEPGEYVLLLVQDTGIGMDAATAQKAFTPFFSTKPRGEGSGLGLSLAFATVGRHRGCIELQSEPARGTVVAIHLPRSTAEAPLERAPARESRAMGGDGELVLLVDDERHLRHMAKRLLEGLNYRVLLAASGEEAESIFRSKHESIRAVILDVVLDGISGEETLDRLRAIDPNVRVLASSGLAREGLPKGLLAQKAVRGFVQKPYGIEEVAQALRLALSDRVAE